MLEVKHYMAPFYYVYLYVYIIVIIHLCTTRKSLSPLNGTLLCLSTTLCGCLSVCVGEWMSVEVEVGDGAEALYGIVADVYKLN